MQGLSAPQRERFKTCGLRSPMQRRDKAKNSDSSILGRVATTGGPSSKNVLDTTMAWGGTS